MIPLSQGAEGSWIPGCPQGGDTRTGVLPCSQCPKPFMQWGNWQQGEALLPCLKRGVLQVPSNARKREWGEDWERGMPQDGMRGMHKAGKGGFPGWDKGGSPA